MQFEDVPSRDARCLNSAAGFWLSTVQFFRGPMPIDNTRAAKLGLRDSLREIGSTEEELKAELEAVIARIRATQKQTKSLERIKPMLLQSKKIKGRLAVLQRMREALDNHMETLESSELNQHVLQSMQRTSNALKAMGLDKSLQAVDKVMLDLEENHSDVSSLQHTLGMSYSDEEGVDWGLELSMLLSDDCCTAPALSNDMLAAPSLGNEMPVAPVLKTLVQAVPQAPDEVDGKKEELAVVTL